MSTIGVGDSAVDIGAAANRQPAPPQPARTESNVGKLASQIARDIEAEIIDRDLPVGHNLGSELELRERYEVSRAVLREAVRLVEHHQMARMRRGPNGGLLVAAPDAGPATTAVVIYLEYLGTSIQDLMYARHLLEPLAASLAAENITEDGIGRLRATLADEAARHDESGVYAQDKLHATLGALSGNPVLELFVEILTRLTTRYAHTARRMTRDEISIEKDHAYRWHKGIVDLVIDGAGGRAGARLDDHLAEVSKWLQEHRNRPTPRRRVVGADLAAAPQTKLAEVVAGRIYDEIVSGNFQIGKVIGSENDLIIRYGVSRAVLREAVRVVESHSVARMRRGPGGGLVVAAPHPQASIDSVSQYLGRRKVSGRDLHAVREALELGILRRVMERVEDDPQVLARLELTPSAIDADRFHRELGALSANPVLALFLNIITLLGRSHPSEKTMPPEVGEEQAFEQFALAHQAIFEAIRDRDEGLARHRMRRHLEAVMAQYH